MKIDYQKLKKINWYRQATDCAPYFIFGPGLAVQKLVSGGFGFTHHIEPHHYATYIDEDMYDTLAKEVLRRFRKNRSYPRQRRAHFEREGRKLENYINKIRELRLREVSDEQLIKYNRDLGKMAYNIWLLPFFLDFFDPNSEKLIATELARERKAVSPGDLAELLRPDEQSMAQQYQTAVMHGSPKRILDKFYFIKCSFAVAPALTLRDIAKDRREFSRNRKATFPLIPPRRLGREKQKIYRRYGFSKWTRDFFGFFQELAVWRDERKTFLQKTVFSLGLLSREIARRSGRPWQEIALFLPYDIKQIPVTRSEIAERQSEILSHPTSIYDPRTRRHVWFDRGVSRKLLSIFDAAASGKRELSGQSASAGTAIGIARIIHGESGFGKFKRGEILVTAMTRPEFLPLMRKAKAIITDEGGITSHAAIVSRELGIPCVIGTRTATRILKDGDLVKVDGAVGKVVVLKRKDK